jgi:hypothetical protein
MGHKDLLVTQTYRSLPATNPTFTSRAASNAVTGQVPADFPKIRLGEIEISVWSLLLIMGG